MTKTLSDIINKMRDITLSKDYIQIKDETIIDFIASFQLENERVAIEKMIESGVSIHEIKEMLERKRFRNSRRRLRHDRNPI